MEWLVYLLLFYTGLTFAIALYKDSYSYRPTAWSTIMILSIASIAIIMILITQGELL